MKKIFFFLITILVSTIVYSQNWYALAGGVLGSVQTIESDVKRNKIYVAGQFVTVDTIQNANGVAQWNGIGWERIGGPGFEIGAAPRFILTLIDDTLYLGGLFNYPNNYIAVWPMAGSWQQHSTSSDFQGYTSISTSHGGIDDFIIFNNQLYAAGSFININFGTPNFQQANNIARWNGTLWETVGNPPGVSKYNYEDYSFIEKMLIYNNELVVIGSFDSVGGVPAYNIGKYNGSTWSNIGWGQPHHPYHNFTGLKTGIVYDNNLYTAGKYWEIYEWDGTDWSIFANVNGIVYDMIEFNGNLIVTGDFTTINNITVNGIARWDGQNWHPFGSGLAQSSQPFGYGVCLQTLNNELYVGGAFDSVDGVAAKNIARYGIETSVIENSNEFNLSLYPNPATSEINVQFELQKSATAVLNLYNSFGQIVKTITKEKFNAGENKINFSTENLPAGIYYLQLKVDDNMVTRKVVKF